MTARDEVVNALDAQTGAGGRLEGCRVIPFAREIDQPTQPTILVRIDEVEPSDLPSVWRVYKFALILVPTKTEAGPADDELDGLREDVLYAIESADNLTWTKCTRGTYQDTTYPAYEVALDVPFIKE